MNVLSLFDGISGARQALHNLGIEDITYMASEIDESAVARVQI
jgi:site-specific DNA-cytosine methylase